ncbi:MAG: hypothetical protein M3Y72_02985 [Acidobacteriota bacterium]|nr:hypothetical protein [Acidobacteriota bacterium]
MAARALVAEVDLACFQPIEQSAGALDGLLSLQFGQSFGLDRADGACALCERARPRHRERD